MDMSVWAARPRACGARARGIFADENCRRTWRWRGGRVSYPGMGKGDSAADGRDNETWLIDAGHAIIEKKRADGFDALTPRERLVHCFWVADYSMRNAGDLATARALDPHYLRDARAAAATLALPVAAAAFGLSEGELERRFFDLFGGMCDELRAR